MSFWQVPTRDSTSKALKTVADSGDSRLAWIVADLLRFLQIPPPSESLVVAFETLTGADVDADPSSVESPWRSVTDHLIASDLPAPPGYLDMKRELFHFEDDTNIQNGPDLYVWLLPAASYGGDTPSGYIDLGTLKRTIGGQNYQLPDGFDPQLHRSVLIWCLRFAVPFASASLG